MENEVKENVSSSIQHTSRANSINQRLPVLLVPLLLFLYDSGFASAVRPCPDHDDGGVPAEDMMQAPTTHDQTTDERRRRNDIMEEATQSERRGKGGASARVSQVIVVPPTAYIICAHSCII